MRDDVMDPNDVASETERLLREDALQLRRPVGPPPTGACFWCDAIVPFPRRWCDAECRDEWERFEARQ